MKKTLIALAIATAGFGFVATPAAFAQTTAPAGHHDGWFVNGQVGRANAKHAPGHETGYQLTGGYRWAIGNNTLLGVEGGYNDLGNIKTSKIFKSGKVVNYDRGAVRGWMVGANGHFNINPNWFLSARAGLYQWMGNGTSNNGNPLQRKFKHNSWYTGAGFGYDFSNNMSVSLNYDYFNAKRHHVNASTDMVSVGAEYRF